VIKETYLRERHHVGNAQLSQLVHLVQKGSIAEPLLGLDSLCGSHLDKTKFFARV
jgi:hypothetical protein